VTTVSGVPNDEAGAGFEEALVGDDAQDLYERAPCGYLSCSPDGTILKVNQTFLSWSGYDRADLVGVRRFDELLSPGGRIYHETHYAPMLRMHGTVREIALDVVAADGRRLPALVNSVLVLGAGDAPVAIRTAVFDAADRREYERELLRAKERAEESEDRARLLAMTLQRTLIPPAVPEIPGLDVSAVYRPARAGDEVGGDFFDIFEVAADDWIVVVGDVCGKGVEAAVITAVARYTIRGAAVRHPDPREVFDVLNQVLLHDESDRYCTAVMVRLRRRRDDGRWTATVSSAGHPLPLLVRAGTRPVAVGRFGTLAGVFAQPRFHDVEVLLEPGDSLVLYTDGVTEARRGAEFYGEARLEDVVSACANQAGGLVPDGPSPSSMFTQGVLRDVLAFQQDDPRDDIAVVAIRPD
jgi:sigma-B regulation protein RsbU (phosphoserine phosphatase)